MRVGSSAVSRVDARIIVATNKNLKDEVLSGNFREDLYFRIHIIPIHLPPLRKRREDIPLLIEHFLDEYAKKNNTPPPTLSQKDMAFFMQYSYPGNVRELQNMIERVCMGYGIKEISASQRPFDSRLFDLPDDIAGLLNSEDPLREARRSGRAHHRCARPDGRRGRRGGRPQAFGAVVLPPDGTETTDADELPPSRVRAKPMRMNITPRPITRALTPKETTEVNSEARRNDAFMTVSRRGSSRSSSA